jgi:hypothetical protein
MQNDPRGPGDTGHLCSTLVEQARLRAEIFVFTGLYFWK